jgi:hypothetical protein
MHPLALLRTRRKRPRGRRTAEQRDEIAAFELIELHSIPASQGRIAGYRIGEDQSGGNGTIYTCQPTTRAADEPCEIGQSAEPSGRPTPYRRTHR